MPRPLEVLGRYQILCPLGAGGMASVFAARVVGAAAFEKLVAVKIMLPHLSRDAKFEQMFADEARVAARVESPHVVSTIDLGRDEQEGLYQVLELVLGSSLRQLEEQCQGELLPLDVALTVLAQAARGLSDAHAAKAADGSPLGLVHRDVSPHNVLIGIDGRARLADFGVARAAARASQTESGELKGKLGYASPEQLAGKAIDARSDVFSLGIVAWETLAGRRLFDADNPLALVDLLVHQPIAALSSVRPDVPERASTLIARMLERDLDRRVASASEVAAELDALARAEGLLASPERLGAFVRERGGAGLAKLEREIQARLAVNTAPPPAQKTARGRLIGAVVALALVASAFALWWTRPPAPAPTAPPPSAAPAPVEPARLPATSVTVPRVETAEATEPVEVPEATVPEAPTDRRRVDRRREPPTLEEAPVEPTETAREETPPSGGLLGVEEFDRE